MKHCEAYTLALSALLDGELSEQERAEALAHLESCEACRAYFAELTAMHDAIGASDAIEVPEGFARGVMSRLHEKKKPQRAATLRKKWAGLAACAAAVALVGTAVLSNFGGKSTDTAAAETEAAEIPAETAETVTEEAYGEESVSAQYYFAEAEEAPAESFSGAAAPNEAAALARVYALSEEAERYLTEQGCGLYEQSDALCSYRAPLEVVRDMAARGLIDENDEALALDDIAEGSVEVVVRVTDTESAQRAEIESEGQPE